MINVLYSPNNEYVKKDPTFSNFDFPDMLVKLAYICPLKQQLLTRNSVTLWEKISITAMQALSVPFSHSSFGEKKNKTKKILQDRQFQRGQQIETGCCTYFFQGSHKCI